ncbi:MAG: radical SAM family heme chaperone HemW [Nitrospirae bacterium]|nr:radical SAM family heme chaperone HemW [Nitrospirota bacterium]
MTESLYIHIPFCLRKCPYCDFFSIPYEKSMEARYVNALIRELRLRRQSIGTLKTIYIGGGTPTVFGADSITRIIEFICDNFNVEHGAEITIEANPSSVDREKLQAIRSTGINRISLGVQSFNGWQLQWLGRLHDCAEAVEALTIIKENFNNFSFDLIYGLPGQSVEDWINSLKLALSFSPPHISAYELTPETGTPLGEWIDRAEASLPAEDDITAMYNAAAELFAGAGLCHYEISNYAIDGFQCRHNQNYWRRGLYAGVGAGAHSHLPVIAQNDSVRSSNAPDITQYLTAIECGTLPVRQEMIIDRRQRHEEDIFLGLRTSEGITIDKLTGIETSALNMLIENGLGTLNGSRFRLTRNGFLVSNRIIAVIIDALPPYSHKSLFP